jgi:hypothetical protein
MNDKAMEERHLVQVNEHIVLAEKHIAQQEARIRKLAADRHDTTKAEKTLLIFKQLLQEMYSHRDLILAALKR